MHLSVLDLLWGQELKKGTGSEFTDSTAFSLEGLVLRALHDRLQESHTNHTMMWDDKRCILALGRNKQSLKTNSTAPPSQTWLQSSQRTSRNLPAPCHHLWSGWLPVWPTQHDDGAGDTQIIKKKQARLNSKESASCKSKSCCAKKSYTWRTQLGMWRLKVYTSQYYPVVFGNKGVSSQNKGVTEKTSDLVSISSPAISACFSDRIESRSKALTYSDSGQIIIIH